MTMLAFFNIKVLIFSELWHMQYFTANLTYDQKCYPFSAQSNVTRDLQLLSLAATSYTLSYTFLGQIID